MKSIELVVVLVLLGIIGLTISYNIYKTSEVIEKKELKVNKYYYLNIFLFGALTIIYFCFRVIQLVQKRNYSDVFLGIVIIFAVGGFILISRKVLKGEYVMYNDECVLYYKRNKVKMSIKVDTITKNQYTGYQLIIYANDEKYIIPKEIEGKRTLYEFLEKHRDKR